MPARGRDLAMAVMAMAMCAMCASALKNIKKKYITLSSLYHSITGARLDADRYLFGRPPARLPVPIMLLALDDGTFTHTAVAFLALPALARLLRTCTRARGLLRAELRLRTERVTAVARTLVPPLATGLYAVFRNQFSSFSRTDTVGENGDVRCVIHITNRNREFNAVGFRLQTSGGRIQCVSWRESQSRGTGVDREHTVAFFPDTALAGAYAFEGAAGSYANGIVACLRALGLLWL